MSETKRNLQRPPAAPAADRLPPHALEAEAGTLGCILLAPLESLNVCEERGVTRDWFYDHVHQLVFAGMTALHQAGIPADAITVHGWLREHGQLTQFGQDELWALEDQTPSAANLPYYLGMLREKWLLRGVVRAGTGLVAGAYSIEEGEKTDAATLVARAEREILRLNEEGSAETERKIKEVILEVVADLEEYHRGQAQIRGLTTGLEYVDKLLCGIGGENGLYYVLSGRPSTGKTALALQIADHVALEHVWWDPVLETGPDGKKTPVKEVVEGMERFKLERKVGLPVGIFSMEMTKKGLVRRLMFRRARADVQRWRTGFAAKEDFEKLTVAVGTLAQAPIYIEDEGIYDWESAKAKARRWARQYGIKLFVGDYFQLRKSADRELRKDRVRELSYISSEIQHLGKELGIPFLELAQMNRDYDKEPNRKPRLSDLKDCGQVEQDADVVGFLYEPKMNADKEEQWEGAMASVYGNDWSRYPRRVNLLVAKARNGPTDDCQLLFQKSCTHFMDWGVWQKEHGVKAPAAGESASRYGNLPSNEEMDLER